MFTFIRQQFHALAEIIANARKRILAETRQTQDSLEFVETLSCKGSDQKAFSTPGQFDWCGILS